MLPTSFTKLNAQDDQDDYKTTMNILDLNDDALEAILTRLSFDEVAQLRLVKTKLNKNFKW